MSVLLFVNANYRTSAAAQEVEPDVLIDQIYRGAVYDSQMIMKRFRDVVTTEHEREVLNHIVVRINRQQTGVYDVYALMEDGTPIINISIGYLSIAFLVETAETYEYLYNWRYQRYNLERENKYVQYIIDTIAANQRRLENGEPVESYAPYLLWIGLNQTEAEVANAEMNSDPSGGIIIASSLAFVLGHELGHHVLGHLLLGRPTAMAEERAADEYSIKLLLKAGIDPSYISSTFLLFAYAEGFRAAPGSTHPNPVCRYWNALNAAYKWKAVGNDEYEQSNDPALTRMKDQYSRVQKEISEDCPE